MNDQQPTNIDFSEVLGDKKADAPQGSQVSGDSAAMILAAIDNLGNAVFGKIADLEANNMALQGRLELAEKYLAFLLTKNPDFKDWLKDQVAEMTPTGMATIGAVLEQKAAAAEKGNTDGATATGQPETKE